MFLVFRLIESGKYCKVFKVQIMFVLIFVIKFNVTFNFSNLPCLLTKEIDHGWRHFNKK